MNVKVGDTVRYLNAVGGGVVTKFQSKDIVLVLEDDGFETPVMVREVVVVPKTNAYNFPTEEKQSKEVQTQSTSQNELQEEETPWEMPPYTFNERDETEEGELLNLYLAFVPKDIKQLQTTAMECYIINDSNYYMQFQLLQGKEEFTIYAQELIEPQTKLKLGDVEKTQLNDFQHIRVQAMAFKKRSFSAKPAIDIAMQINPVRFFKLHTFTENDFFDEHAHLITLVENDVLDLGFQINAADLQKAMTTKELPQPKKQPARKRKDEPILEVDLHAHELIDTTAGLSNGDILRLQMDKFHEVMQANLKNKGKKIVFIHGKGEGILRNELEKVLRQRYKYCYYQDASFQQYGYGATQVTIR